MSSFIFHPEVYTYNCNIWETEDNLEVSAENDERRSAFGYDSFIPNQNTSQNILSEFISVGSNPANQSTLASTWLYCPERASGIGVPEMDVVTFKNSSLRW